MTSGSKGDRTLSLRELNRALLARQMLLGREETTALEAMERLVGLQAQVPSPPYVGLWTRIEDFRREELVRLVMERQVVRATLMRATIHLMSARDYAAFRLALHPALAGSSSTITGKRLAGLDLDGLIEAATSRFDEEPCTFAELRATLAEIEPERDPSALAYAVRTHLPLVQVPSGSAWGYAGNAPFATAEAWLDVPLEPDEGAHEMIRRYLAAFGPASVMDFQAWSGMRRMKAAFEELRPETITFRDESGRELFDVPDAPRPEPDTPAPPRFVPDYDNLMLSHADRSRIIAGDHKKHVFLSAARVRATVLVDGFVAGTWKVEKARGEATLTIEPFGELPKSARDALTDEGEGLVRFLREGAKSHHVRFE